MSIVTFPASQRSRGFGATGQLIVHLCTLDQGTSGVKTACGLTLAPDDYIDQEDYEAWSPEDDGCPGCRAALKEYRESAEE